MIILDANVWIAFFDNDDSHHERAQQTLYSSSGRLVLPEYVLLEVISVLQRKRGKNFADVCLTELIFNQDLVLLMNDANFIQDFYQFFLNNNYEQLSFVDQFLLFLSQEYSIVTFDKALAKKIKRL